MTKKEKLDLENKARLRGIDKQDREWIKKLLSSQKQRIIEELESIPTTGTEKEFYLFRDDVITKIKELEI